MKVVVFGSNGLVGSSLINNLEDSSKVTEIIPSTRETVNLFSLEETKVFINKTKPNLLINAAAKVGGIMANNSYRTQFILDNLKINVNILESIIDFPEIKLINLGSSCIYPLGAENPIKENYLMTGRLEPTNSPYAMAKLTAIEMGDALSKQYGHSIVNLMPTNLYGPNDNFSEKNSHVIPGLIHRMHQAREKNEEKFIVWGTGKPMREFLFVDDLAKAINFIIDNEINDGILNVGSGDEVSIEDLVLQVAKIIKFEGEIIYDENFPDGNPRKLLDSSKLKNYGWSPGMSLGEGLKITNTWYVNNILS